MTQLVLDASAVLAVLFNEQGADKVIAYLPGALLSCVNLAEVSTRILEVGKPLDDALFEISRLPLRLVDYDAGQAHITASLRKETKSLGLSLGDRACLALGLARQATVVTGDRHWQKLKIGLDIIVFR